MIPTMRIEIRDIRFGNAFARMKLIINLGCEIEYRKITERKL